MRRLRRPAAWLVALRPDETDTGPPSRGGPRPLLRADPPWWSRRFLPAALCLVLVAVLGLWADQPVGAGLSPLATGQVSVEVVASGECVGYSDSAAAGVQQRPRPGPAAHSPTSASSRRTAPPRRSGSAATDVGPSSPWSTWAPSPATGPARTRSRTSPSARSSRDGHRPVRVAEGVGAAPTARRCCGSWSANGGRQMRYADRAVAMLPRLARDDPRCSGWSGWWRAAPAPPGAARAEPGRAAGAGAHPLRRQDGRQLPPLPPDLRTRTRTR